MDGKSRGPYVFTLTEGIHPKYDLDYDLIGGVMLMTARKAPEGIGQGALWNMICQEARQQDCAVQDLLLNAMTDYWLSLCGQKKETAN